MLSDLRIGVLCVAAACALPMTVQAQRAPDESAILATVRQLFDGMRAGDSAMVHAAFHPRAQLATAVTRLGKAGVEFDSLDTFVRNVGTPHDSIWDERVRNQSVRQDATLATVWAEYSFYVGSRFNHCGVDAIQLAKVGEGWRIVALTDTRRRRPCPEQP